MARDGNSPVRDAVITAVPRGDTSSKATVSGQIILNDDETGPHRIDVVGPEKILSADCQEIAENTRAIRRGKAAPRRILRVEPLSVDMTDGPVVVVLRSAEARPRVVAHLDLPGSGLRRFRHLLQLELDQDLARRLTNRRTIRLERGFAKLPESPDCANWLESWIILNCLRRTRTSRTHAFVGQLQRLRTEQGCPERFAHFMSTMTDTHGLQLPNTHGYGSNLEQRDRTALWRGISDIMTLLKGMGMTVFLNSGTLLGAVREGDLLGHDDDIDLAVLIPGNSQEEAAQSWLELRQRLDDKGILGQATHRSKYSVLKLPRIDGVQVDLFPAWIDSAGALFIYPHTRGDLKRTDLLPLKPGPHPGTRIPAKADRILEKNYGPDWRVPDPHFRFPWAASAAPFFAFMSVLRAAQEAEVSQ